MTVRINGARQRHYELACRVGLYPETWSWSRIRKRGNVDLETLCRLGDAVGLKVALLPADPLWPSGIVRRELFRPFKRKRD